MLRVNLVNENDWNDDDEDGILDENDLCQFGESGWESTAMNDYDGDGCRDEQKTSMTIMMESRILWMNAQLE